MIQPFRAEIPEPVLADLKSRLENTRWPDEITASQWLYGTSLSYMKELTDYWIHRFNWRQVETELNQYPNFIGDIDGYKIHFLHIKGNGKRKLPLVITHGWPGSVLEMMKLVPLLTSDPGFSFDLVIPSVIGFGFSGKANHAGCDSSFIAGLWHKLMHELGYDRYGAQGGDIGAGISTWLALKHPESVTGLHLNYIPASYKPYGPEGAPVSPELSGYSQQLSNWMATEGGYAHLHSTKPLTLAYGLNDSPVGLCAWIIEKFNSWSDNNGHIENCFTKEELLANATLYWVTQSIHSSIRIYRENRAHPLTLGQNDFIKPPVAFARFPKELPTPPRSHIEKGFNLQRWTDMPKGGHFAAMEQPALLAKDLLEFFQAFC